MMGFLTGTYDIAALLFSPIVGYLGETRRKPVWCSCGLFLMGVGFFVFLVPHLIVGPYKADKAGKRGGRGWGIDLCSCIIYNIIAASVERERFYNRVFEFIEHLAMG